MYSNPGAWASLLGVDFVRNNKAKGIDYATMHVYVDQWLCVEEGSTRKGQLDFMRSVLSDFCKPYCLIYPCKSRWPFPRLHCASVSHSCLCIGHMQFV